MEAAEEEKGQGSANAASKKEEGNELFRAQR